MSLFLWIAREVQTCCSFANNKLNCVTYCVVAKDASRREKTTNSGGIDQVQKYQNSIGLRRTWRISRPRKTGAEWN